MASPAGGRFGRCVSPDPKSGELPKYAGSKTGGNNEYVPLRTGVSSDGGAVGGARRAMDGRSESILLRVSRRLGILPDSRASIFELPYPPSS